MKRLLFTSLFAFAISAQAADKPPGMVDYRWKHRVLILFLGDASSIPAQTYMAVLNGQQSELTERDMVVFATDESGNARRIHFDAEGKAVETSLSARDAGLLLNTYAPEDRSLSRTVLIGKDGGVKLQKELLEPLPQIFALIDQMPMRRAEMGRDTSN